MICPSCGHSNDAGNRFCEYCGARLDPSMAQEATQVGSLGNPMDTSYDAPTMFVPTDQAAPPAPAAEPAPTPAAPASSGEARCSVCGYVNQAGDRFCDQCGASLQSAAPASPAAGDAQSASSAAPTNDEQTVVGIWKDEEATVDTNAPTPAGGTPVSTPASQESDAALLASMVATPANDDAPTVPAPADDEAPTLETGPHPVASTPEPVAAAPATPAATQDRAALEALIQEKRDELAGLEQMATRYQGKAVPAYVTAGMDEVRSALTDAEAQLAALDAATLEPPIPQPDPAEVERLTNLIQEKRDELAGLEQMATRYQGKAVPAYVTAGMDEVRGALTDAEAELARLRGGNAVPDVASNEPATDAASSEPVAPAVSPAADATGDHLEMPTAPAAAWTPPPAGASWNAPEPASPPAAEPVQEAAPATPAAPAQEAAPAAPAAQPRLVVQASSAVINLPTDKAVLVIGREDPISGIFPEVDLTTHGGESGGVSRQHARILYDNGNWQVEDLNSTNYTKVNGSKIAPHTPTAIKDGDQVQFGRVLLTFHAA